MGGNLDFSVYLSPLRGRKETGKGSREVLRERERRGSRGDGERGDEERGEGERREGERRKERREIATILAWPLSSPLYLWQWRY